VVDQAITPHGAPVVQRLLQRIQHEAGPTTTQGAMLDTRQPRCSAIGRRAKASMTKAV